MSKIRMPKRMLKGRLYTTRYRGRPRMRWLDGVTADLANMGMREWRGSAENREAWRSIVEEAISCLLYTSRCV